MARLTIDMSPSSFTLPLLQLTTNASPSPVVSISIYPVVSTFFPLCPLLLLHFKSFILTSQWMSLPQVSLFLNQSSTLQQQSFYNKGFNIQSSCAKPFSVFSFPSAQNPNTLLNLRQFSFSRKQTPRQNDKYARFVEGNA